MVKELTYPYCLKNGDLVSPGDIETGDPDLVCLDCDSRMIVRKGQIKAHHFAHYSGFVPSGCSGEGALHRALKMAIVDSFNTWESKAEDYPIEFLCDRCNRVARNSFPKGLEIVSEKYLSPSLRPDLTIFNDNFVMTIEVVVKHPPSESALQEYERLGIPVAIVKADVSDQEWASVRQVRKSLQALNIINVPETWCSHCMDKEGFYMKRWSQLKMERRPHRVQQLELEQVKKELNKRIARQKELYEKQASALPELLATLRPDGFIGV
jgi:hypothetical protein